MSEYNPGRKKGEQGKQGRAPVPSTRQINTAFARCEGYPYAKRNKAILAMFFGLGLRPKECASLMLTDVYDFETDDLVQIITLLKGYTKRKKVRQIHLNNQFVRDMLLEYIDERKQGKQRHFNTMSPLFVTKRGGAFTANSLGNLMNEILEKRANIKGGCSYSGRRYFATKSIKEGTDINTVRVLMGHESLATTQRYIEADPELMAAATEKIL